MMMALLAKIVYWISGGRTPVYFMEEMLTWEKIGKKPLKELFPDALFSSIK